MKAMKRILVILFALGLMSGLSAQSKIRLDFDEAKLRLEEYNTERLLD